MPDTQSDKLDLECALTVVAESADGLRMLAELLGRRIAQTESTTDGRLRRLVEVMEYMAKAAKTSPSPTGDTAEALQGELSAASKRSGPTFARLYTKVFGLLRHYRASQEISMAVLGACLGNMAAKASRPLTPDLVLDGTLLYARALAVRMMDRSPNDQGLQRNAESSFSEADAAPDEAHALFFQQPLPPTSH